MKRQITWISLLCAGALPLSGGEHKVQSGPFEKVVKLEGKLLPDRGVPFRIEPEAWTTFSILELVEQGAAVKKGEALVVVDTEDLDRKIADTKEADRIRRLDLANAKRELANLEISTPRKMEAAERTFQRAKEDLAYFKEVGRPEAVQAARRSVERAERQLEYQREELEQLLAMYEEDDLTEETEEIILKRQRNTVSDAENFLHRARLASKKTLETDLPRQAQDLNQRYQDAELAWTSYKETLPRGLKKKNLEVKKLIEEDKRAQENLANLKADRKLMELHAPESGRVYYGQIKDGAWKAGQTAKYMKRGGNLPAKTTFATLIPDEAGLQLHVAASEAQVFGLRIGQKGYFSPTGAPRRRLQAELVSVAAYPNLAGAYPLTCKLAGNMDGLVAGMGGTLRLVTEARDAALTVPVSALHEKGDGSLMVKLKGPNGNEVERAVEVGAEANGKVVVTSGLSAGDVVLTKEEKAK